MKKLNVAVLGMSLVLVAPMHALDVNTLEQQARQIKEKLAVIVPSLTEAARTGNFEAFKSDLKAGTSELDLNSAMQSAADYLGQIKSFFSGLQNDPRVASVAREVLPYLDEVKNNFYKIRDNVNLDASIDSIASALEEKKGKLKAKLDEFRIDSSYRTVEGTDFGAIGAAIPLAVRVANGGLLRGNESAKLARGLGQVRRLVPALVSIIQGFADLALTTNAKLARDLKMNPAVQSAVKSINEAAGKIREKLKELNDQLDAAAAGGIK